MKVEDIKPYYDVYSSLKAIYWLKDIERIKNGEMIPPKFLEVHPEAFCSHRCKPCAYRYSGWDKHGMEFLKPEWAGTYPDFSRKGPVGKRIPEVSGMPKVVALNLPKQMRDEGIDAIEITGSGEPLLYPYINELLGACCNHLEDIAIVTNGQFFHRVVDSISHLTWLRFSVDARYPGTYEEVHGIPCFDQVVDNLRLAVDTFRDAYIGVSYVVTRDNFGEVYDAVEFYKGLGVRNIRFTFEYEPSGTANLTTRQVEAVRIMLDEAKGLQDSKFRVFGQVGKIDMFSRPNTDFTFCGYQLLSWNVGYDCLCYPCCVQIYNPSSAFGDLSKQDLHEIIYGERRRKFIEEFDVTKCNPCWLREKNIAIETVLAPEKRLGHVRYV